MESSLDVWMMLNQRNLWMNSMKDFVVDISLLKPIPTKSLEQDTIGPPYFQMCISLSESVSHVSFSQGNRN